VIVDVGAHVGSFSWSCLRRGAGTVVAVEPMPENLERLKINLLGHSGKFEIIPKGIWFENGSVTVDGNGCHANGVSSTFNLVHQGDSGRQIETITLEAVIDRACSLSESGRVRMLKLDCEGGEYPGLLWCSNLGRVDAICGEIHRHTFINGREYSTQDISSRLAADGFIVTVEENGPNTDLIWAIRTE
jgi:FkbM family methyltransferase